MTIISSANLTSELPSDTDSATVTKAITEASALTNGWARHYEQFPDVSDNTILAPREIGRACIEIAKAIYFLGVGQVYRDGNEQESWQGVLDYYKGYLLEVDIEPTVSSVAISLNSDGVQLIARNQHILRYHPECRVVSAADATGTMWNQGKHWDIRKGNDSDDEFMDGWYFDADTYQDTIEGSLYYARSWRNDSKDYLKYSLGRRSMDGALDWKDAAPL